MQFARTWLAIVAVWLAFFLCSLQAQFTYVINNNSTIGITGYNGPANSLTIPDTIDGLPVTSIEDFAFENRNSLASVAIPNSVTNIGRSAFEACWTLESVTLGNKVASIGTRTFRQCGLSNLIIPASVTRIGAEAFANCSRLKGVYFEGDAPALICDPFHNCSLTAQDDSTNIPILYYLQGKSGWSASFGGRPTALWPPVESQFSFVAINGTITIRWPGYTGPGGTVVIPETINGLPVTSIEGSAFTGNMTSVVIPNSVRSIGDGAFNSCWSLTNVIIGSGVTNIGRNAFLDSPLLGIAVDAANPAYSDVDGVLFDKGQTVLIRYPKARGGSYEIPNTVVTLKVNAFAFSGLTGVTIPNSVTTLEDGSYFSSAFAHGGNGVFCYSRLTSVVIPKTVTNIGKAAFAFTSLRTAVIGNGVTNIDDYAFADCYGLTNVTIGNSVARLGFDAFRYCTSLTDIIIPNSVRSLNATFRLCTRLSSVNIPNSVTDLGFSTFENCTSLTSMVIPGSVTNIGRYAFFFCTSLTAVYFEGDAPTFTCLVQNCSLTEQSDASRRPTIYYLPGTTGWSPMFAGHPTALWRDLRIASWTTTRNGFLSFQSAQPWPLAVTVEASKDLRLWSPIFTNTAVNGTVQFLDPDGPQARRFYRLRSAE